MARWIGTMLAILWLASTLAGCGDSAAPASARAESPRREILRPSVVAEITEATYHTSPPGHPSLDWSELAPRIKAARLAVERLGPVGRPAGPSDVLAERIGSDRLRALAEVRNRAMVHRAEAARQLALGRPDDAAAELCLMLDLAREASVWGAPAAAEASAHLIGDVLDAMDRPLRAPITAAMSTVGRARLRAAFARLDANDPAGRMRAMVETIARREAALRERAATRDGPVVVRGIASRYAPGAELGTAEAIDRSMREAVAFSRALADGWEKPSRLAITNRLRQRQADDGTGVLVVLLGEAPDACDADAQLRARIAAAMEALR